MLEWNNNWSRAAAASFSTTALKRRVQPGHPQVVRHLTEQHQTPQCLQLAMVIFKEYQLKWCWIHSLPSLAEVLASLTSVGGELKVQGEDRRGISVSGTVGLLELFVLEGLIQSGSHLCCVMSLTDHTPDWNVTKITSIPLIINTHLIFLLLELQSTTHSAQKYEQYRYICVCVCVYCLCVCAVCISPWL